MKTSSFLLSVFCLLSFSLFAQEENTDTTKFRFKNMIIEVYSAGNVIDEENITVIQDEDKEKKATDVNHWSGIEFGTTGYFNSKSFDINNDPQNLFMELDFSKSFVFNLNFAEHNFNLIKNKILLMTGLGLRFNRYAFKSTQSVLSFNDTMVFNSPDSIKKFDKNFLNASYISAPLFIKFLPGKNPEKSFHFSAGAILSYRIGSRLKQKYVLNNQNFKDISRGHYHLSPFLLDASIRMGVGDVTLFANYTLNAMFEKDKGPQYYPFSAGISFNW